jgi:hypothetical protein
MGASNDHPADQDKIQTGGREANAAQDLNAAPDNAGAERYPSVKKDDSVEPRSFGGKPGNPEPRQGAGDISPSATDARLGPGGDPVEGKR